MEILIQNFANIELQHIIMWAIGGILIYLAIAKEMEPTLLLPMGFGAILVNLPLEMPGTGVQHVIDTLFSIGIDGAELFPLLLFIGIGAGLCVRAGGATTGDDALAMSFSHIFKWPIERVYLISDLTVLLLSLSYIPVRRIAYSLLTVILSGQIIGLIQKVNFKKK